MSELISADEFRNFLDSMTKEEYQNFWGNMHDIIHCIDDIEK